MEFKEDRIVAADVTNIVLKNAGYYWNVGYNEFEFSCKIKGKEDTLRLMEYRHDEGSGITIHADKEDIWEKLNSLEVWKLHDKLQEEIKYGTYHRYIEEAKTLEDCNEIEIEAMEDDNVYFNRVSQRVWKELYDKRQEIENGLEKAEVDGKDEEKEYAIQR